MIKQLIFVPIFLFSLPALSATTSVRTTSIKVYEVEVIVFQNIQSKLDGNEIWINERIEMELKDIDSAVDAWDIPRPDSELSMAFDILDSDGSYRVLSHKRWLQNASPRSDSRLVRLSTDDGELQGTIKFFVSRFLHVDLNLVYHQKESKSIFQAGDADGGSMVVFQLREKRRVRSNEIQYFDHPKLGALVHIKKLKVSKN